MAEARIFVIRANIKIKGKKILPRTGGMNAGDGGGIWLARSLPGQ